MIVQKEISKGEKSITYSRGWRDGASGKVLNKALSDHENTELVEIYNLGYSNGQESKLKAINKYNKSIEQKPKIIKLKNNKVISMVDFLEEVGEKVIDEMVDRDLDLGEMAEKIVSEIDRNLSIEKNRNLRA